MKYLLFLLLPALSHAQDYSAITKKMIVTDTHNDILTSSIEKNVSMDNDLRGRTHSDLNRFKQGGVDLQVFSVWCDGKMKDPYAWANREMDTLDAVVARNPNRMVFVKTWRQVKRALRGEKLAAMFGVEGGHMIENSLDKLNELHDRGAVYLTLTWNNSVSWATSAADETSKKDSLAATHKGLTDFGKQVVRRMNELGMIVDISHTGEATFWDAINTTSKPLIASHSNAYALCPVPRNLKDDQILAIGKNGGVIDLNFYAGFVDSTFKAKEDAFRRAHREEITALRKSGVQDDYALTMTIEKYPDEIKSARPPLNMLLDHLDYIVKLIGVDHVGLGSDFDGITFAPQQLDDVTTYPVLVKAMMERGYRKKDIRKIMGGNFLRVLKANLD